MTITLAPAQRRLGAPHPPGPRWRPPTRPAPGLGEPDGAPARSRAPSRDERFAALQADLADLGGCVTGDALAERLRPHWDQPLSRVARWIVRRRIVSVTWQAQVWIPLFQFERPSLDVAAVVSDVVAELGREFDDWDLAEWFARPHELLGGHAPARSLAATPCAVRAAARMDRFVSRW